jgi:hypothetical protein
MGARQCTLLEFNPAACVECGNNPANDRATGRKFGNVPLPFQCPLQLAGKPQMQLGWICPVCAQVNAPFVTACPCSGKTAENGRRNA